jgi:hypothetical protein
MRSLEFTPPTAWVLAAIVLGALGCAGRLPATDEYGPDPSRGLVTAPRGDCGSRFVQGDFDGDGASDYACLYDLGDAEAVILVMPGTASGPTEEVWWQAPAGEFDARRCGARFVAGDFTGDGTSDLACLYSHGHGSAEVVVFSSTGSAFEVARWAEGRMDDLDAARCEDRFVVGDFNGDGRSDLACSYDRGSGSGEVLVLTSTGSGFDRAAWHRWSAPDLEPSRCASRLVAADFDGDGSDDLACMDEHGSESGDIFVFLSRSTRFEVETWHRAAGSDFAPLRCGGRLVAGDFNGDGKSDLACMSEQRKNSLDIFVFASDGARFHLERWHDERAPGFDPTRCDGRFAAGTLDDDGLDDLVCMYDAGLARGFPQGQAAQSRILAFFSTGTHFGRAATWPSAGTGPAALDAAHCAGRFFVGKTPSPYVQDTLWGDVSCGIDYGTLGVGVRRHLLNPHLLAFEHPVRAVGDPLHAARGASVFVPRRMAACRAVQTLVYHVPTLGHADVEYRRVKRDGQALVLVGTTPAEPFVVWIPPDVTPEHMTLGEAHYDDGVLFSTAFAALAAAHRGMIRMASFDEPYWFHAPISQDKKLIRAGYAPFKEVLVDAAKAIHTHGIPVWVNFSRPELELMIENPPVPLNSPHFDIISMDSYHHGTALLGTADVPAWFAKEVEPWLDALHGLRVPVAWNPRYAGQLQKEMVVTDGFVFQPWNASEIQNVNDLFYQYSEWARAVNLDPSDPAVLLQAPFAWSEDVIYNGLSVVPSLLRYWDDFNRLPLCP